MERARGSRGRSRKQISERSLDLSHKDFVAQCIPYLGYTLVKCNFLRIRVIFLKQ